MLSSLFTFINTSSSFSDILSVISNSWAGETSTTSLKTSWTSTSFSLFFSSCFEVDYPMENLIQNPLESLRSVDVRF